MLAAAGANNNNRLQYYDSRLLALLRTRFLFWREQQHVDAAARSPSVSQPRGLSAAVEMARQEAAAAAAEAAAANLRAAACAPPEPAHGEHLVGPPPAAAASPSWTQGTADEGRDL